MKSKKQNQSKNQLPNKVKSSSFSISNKIEQTPLNVNVIRSKNGYKVVSRGADNLLPYRISKIVKESVTLSNVIYSKAEYCANGELIATPKTVSKLNDDLNPDYNFAELIKRTTIDSGTYGYFFIELVRVGSEKYVYHLPA